MAGFDTFTTTTPDDPGFDVRKLREHVRAGLPTAYNAGLTDYGEAVTVYFEKRAAPPGFDNETWAAFVAGIDWSEQTPDEQRRQRLNAAVVDVQEQYADMMSILDAGESQVAADLAEVDSDLSLNLPQLTEQQRWALVLRMAQRQRSILFRQRETIRFVRRLIELIRWFVIR